jgi:hypothetical protein
MGIGVSRTSVNPSISGSGSDNVIAVGDAAMKVHNNSAVQHVIDTAGRTTSKLLENGGSLLSAPAVWLSAMQQNWLTYIIVAAVILSILAFFYCSFCYRFNPQKNNLSGNGLIELAKVISDQTGALQRPLPLPILNLPPMPPNPPLPSNATTAPPANATAAPGN